MFQFSMMVTIPFSLTAILGKMKIDLTKMLVAPRTFLEETRHLLVLICQTLLLFSQIHLLLDQIHNFNQIRQVHQIDQVHLHDQHLWIHQDLLVSNCILVCSVPTYICIPK